MKRNFILLIIFLFLQNCGYTPILSNYNDQKINFNIVEIKGNDEMNNILKLHMKKYSNKSNGQKIDLKIKTDSQKSILSKNKKGEATRKIITGLNHEHKLGMDAKTLKDVKLDYLTAETKTVPVSYLEANPQIVNNHLRLQEYQATVNAYAQPYLPVDTGPTQPIDQFKITDTTQTASVILTITSHWANFSKTSGRTTTDNSQKRFL